MKILSGFLVLLLTSNVSYAAFKCSCNWGSIAVGEGSVMCGSATGSTGNNGNSENALLYKCVSKMNGACEWISLGTPCSSVGPHGSQPGIKPKKN